MTSRDRFDSTVDEPTANCIACGVNRPTGELQYDDQAEHFICDRDCFHDWADANIEVVADYYYESVIGY